jgi:threonine dehydrogenase-like Zn-dependent dehydrogenase
MKTIFIDSNKKNISKKERRNKKFINFFQGDDKIPAPSGSELLIKTIACGVCSTDISKILNPQKMINQNKVLDRKFGRSYLGHEVVGKVIAAGNIKNKFMIDKLITLGDVNTCKSFNILPECEQCQKKRGVHCTHKNKRKFNNKSYGGYSEYFIRSIHQCLILPSNINPIKAIFIEPLSTAINCANFCNKDDAIIINGLTTISVLFYRLLLSRGFNKKLIFINVQNKKQQKQAISMKFTNVIINMSKKDVELTKKDINNLKKKPVNGFTFLIDFRGYKKEIQNLLQYLHPGGCLMLFGLNDNLLNLNFHEFVNKGLNLRGIHGYSSQLVRGKYKSDLEAAKELIIKDKIDVLDLVERRGKISNAYNLLVSIVENVRINNNKLIKNDRVYFRTILV